MSNKSVRKMITKNIIKQKLGHKYYHLKDEEAYIVAAIKIEGAHGLPKVAVVEN